MKESVFIKKYQDKWKDLENYLATHGKSDPDYLSTLYVQLTDDLSFAKTHYPDSKITIYLNQLSSKLHSEIYKNKKEDKKRIITFWTHEVPLLMYKYRNIFILSFIAFILSFGIGWISSENDPTFVRLIMGDAYVDMTIDNIEKGKPMDVYGKSNEEDMFLMICTNNIFVSFLFFVLGLFVGIGSLWKLVSTGIMVGSFMYIFKQNGVLSDALLSVWMHGTIEITVAVISCGAGMIMGTSMLFTGTYSRIESLKRGALDGIKIVLGMSPLFFIAAIIESYLTRHYNVSIYLSMGIILISAAFLISYFVVYPWYLGSRMKKLTTIDIGEQYNDYKIDLGIGIVLLVVILIVGFFTYKSMGLIFVYTGGIIFAIRKIMNALKQKKEFLLKHNQ